MKNKKCLSCNKATKKSITICEQCVRQKEIRYRFGIKTASDYQLSSEDYLHNAFCFLHACGQLQEVIDKIESEVAELMMNSVTTVNNNPNQLISSYCMEQYDELSLASRSRSRFNVFTLGDGVKMDYMEIGPAPCEENCAQVGEPDFKAKATKEMNAYINQLYRQFPELENNNTYLKKKWYNHDFGTYGEVVVVYDENDNESYDLAIRIENNLPYEWDEQALEELKS